MNRFEIVPKAMVIIALSMVIGGMVNLGHKFYTKTIAAFDAKNAKIENCHAKGGVIVRNEDKPALASDSVICIKSPTIIQLDEPNVTR